MKLIHISDLHIGKTLGNYSLIEDQRYALDGVLAIARAREVSAIIIAGDVYDKASPSAEAVSLFDEFLTKAADASLPVIATPGNHDSAERLSFAQDILKRQGVYFPPVYDGDLERVTLHDEEGDVVFWLMPFIKPANVRRCFPDLDLKNDYTAAVAAVLDRCAVDKTQRNVLVAHQFVTSGSGGPERADEEIDLGGLDNVDASLFDDFDYVALGHVHRPQRIGRDVVRYSGSLLKYSVSEATREKTLVIVDMGAKAAGSVGDGVSFELVPIPCMRDLRVVEGPLAELISREVVTAANADDYVFARLTDGVPQLDAMGKLRNAYPHVIGVEEVSYSATRDAADDEALSLEDLNPFDAFETFFEQQTGKSLEARQKEIAARVLRASLEDDASSANEANELSSPVAKGGDAL